MFYRCPRCNYETINLVHYKKHLNRKKKCTNVLNVSEDTNLLVKGKYESDKKVIKKNDKEFVCTKCNSKRKSLSSLYRHINKIHSEEKSMSKSNKNVKNDSKESLQKENGKVILKNIKLSESSRVLDFGLESTQNYDTIDLIESLFNEETEGLSELFTVDLFARVHNIFLNNIQNLNSYCSSVSSKKIIIKVGGELKYMDKKKFLKERILKIHDHIILKLNELFKRKISSRLLEFIYEKYNHKYNLFVCEIENHIEIINILIKTINLLFEAYEQNQQNYNWLNNEIINQLFEKRKDTKIMLENINFEL